MITHSRQTIHMGINFVVFPSPRINMQSNLRFQQFLSENGIECPTVKFKEKERKISIARESPTPLNIQVGITTSSPSFGQLLIFAPQSGSSLEMFSKEAEMIVEAFNSTWPTTKRQIITCDVTFRDLYETSSEHAFLELWETHLDQSAEALKVLGRPVLGGGLRFVMPPQPDDDEPVMTELKIESFLKNTKKIFIETQFKWPQPTAAEVPLDPHSRLKQVDDYIENKVVAFMGGESQ